MLCYFYYHCHHNIALCVVNECVLCVNVSQLCLRSSRQMIVPSTTTQRSAKTWCSGAMHSPFQRRRSTGIWTEWKSIVR